MIVDWWKLSSHTARESERLLALHSIDERELRADPEYAAFLAATDGSEMEPCDDGVMPF